MTYSMHLHWPKIILTHSTFPRVTLWELERVIGVKE